MALLGEVNPKATAAEVFSAAVCNMNCKYCYIPKTPEMYALHQKVIAAIEDGSMINYLKSLYGDTLECLGFWGTEPTLTLHKIIPKLDEIVKAFPRLKQVSLSSNMLLPPDSLIELAKKLAQLKPGIKYECQISMDGPAWITDVNRSPGATSKIKAHYAQLVCELARLRLPVEIDICFKPTLTADNIKLMNTNPELVTEWFQHFDELFEFACAHTDSHNRYLRVSPYASPSMMVPGKYTSEDGKELTKFFDLCWRLEQSRRFEYLKPPLVGYVGRMHRLIRFQSELHTKPAMFTCSGGDSNFAIGIMGEVHVCHRSYFTNHQEYKEAVLGHKDLDNWDVSLFESGKLDILEKNYILKPDDQESLPRIQYIMRNYHDYLTGRMATTIATIKQLAISGQVGQIYLESDEMCAMLALFLQSGHSCPTESIINTGTTHLVPVSLIRLFGNGALECILRYF